MSTIDAGPGRMELSEAGRAIHGHYQQLLRTKRIYSALAAGSTWPLRTWRGPRVAASR